MSPHNSASGRSLPILSAALAAVGLLSTAHAQVQVAGDLLINVDATTATVGPLTSIANIGTKGGFFEPIGGGANNPMVVQVSGNGTRGIQLDGSDFLQHVATPGGALVPADPTLTGANPTCTIEAWVLNPGISQEETVVSWGHRGGNPDGSNMSFNYGWDDRWGAVGHWGAPDIGWDPCCNGGSNPPGVPKSGVWHHLVYTYDGTTQRVYADGVLKNSETVGLSIFPNPPVTIGAQMADDVTVEPGLRGTLTIGRLRIHSEALNDSQISSNYNLEKGDFSEGGSLLTTGPVHRYNFNNASGAAGAATVPDIAGGADGTVKGSGANFTGTRLTLPGGSSGSAGYVDLPNGLLSTNGVANGGSGQISWEGWIKNTGTRNWGRVFDFGNGTAGELTGPGGSAEGRDYFFLSGTEGTNPQRHNTSIRNLIPPAGSDTGVGWDTANANRDYHFVVTWDEATGVVSSYENGALVSTLTFDPSTNSFSSIQDMNVWLGRSQWTGDENFQGEYDEFRIYDRVLPPEQVREDYIAGPDLVPTSDTLAVVGQPQSITVNELQSATFGVSLQGQPPVALQWYLTNGMGNAALADATNYSLTWTGSLPAQTGYGFYVVAHHLDLINDYSVTSSVATLTVLGDTNPPTVLQVRVDSSNQLEVVFSEPVRAEDATNIANYVLSGPNAPTITGAAVGADASRVVLTLDGPLTACDFYNLMVSGVHDVSVTGNLMVPAASSFWNYVLPGLTHRYTFNTPALNDATGATVPDIVGGADGIVQNAGGTTRLTGSRVTLSGGSSVTAPYIDLPNGLLSNNSTNRGGTGQLTFEGWVKVTGINSWSRILDFGSTTGGEVTGPGGGGTGLDYLFYSAMNGTDTTLRRIDFTNHDPTDQGAVGQDFGTATFNQDFHFVITWDEASGQIRVYENGSLAAFTTTDDPMSDINDVNVWLGRSNWAQDGNLQGEFDEFRVYNKVLSTQDIQRNRVAGPDNNFGGLLTLDLVPTTNSMVTNTVGAVQVLAGFSNLGTQNVAAAGCVMYSSTDSNIVYITDDGVIHAVNAGTATVTASLGGLMDSEMIEVTQDATPPSLLFARANGLRSIEIAFSEPVEAGTAEEAGNYQVSGPSGPIDIASAQRLSDHSRVLLTLVDPMPCEYITVLVSFVADESPLFNQIADNSPVSFMNYAPAGLQHRYTFNNGAGDGVPGTIVPDGAGAGDAVLLGTGATFSGDRVVLPGGASTSAAYIDLPNNVLSGNSVNNGGSGKITIEGWVKVTGNHTWARIFDFGSSGPCCTPGIEITGPGGGGEGIDYLMLSAQNGNDVNTRRLEIKNRDEGDFGALTIDHAATFNHYDYFVVTWDESTHEIRAYENGNLVTSGSSAAAFSQINDVNVWLGRSTWTGDQNLQGEFDEFRLYNRILSTNEMAMNATVGPDNNFGQPQALRITAPSPVTAGSIVSPTVNVDFTSISNADLTPSACFTLESSDSGVLSVDPSGVVHAVGNGTANLIARFSGLSNSVPVTVGSAATQGRVTIARSGANYTISFSGGTPGTTYRIERTTNLTAPVTWDTIATLPAAPDGTLSTDDTSPPPNQAFYRVVTP